MSEKASVHGHEVMNMIIESGKSYTTESLIADIHATFGEDTRFHTCSAENMDAKALVSFLAARGKFIGTEEGFSTSAEKICNH
ncbi:YecH family protein [Morganella morganii]|uniref:YecH family metal-binding protein n=1 Tax=Morganella morganii TaxID=582 RepID=UPI00164B5A91|nr:YecH family metal-binding protein [Morganella morganii]MBC4012067.1 YecH family protein [Morganella morganii]